jgi:anti-sigma B factor antagonist
MALNLKLTSQDHSGLTLLAAEGEATAHDFPSGNAIHFDNVLGPTWDTARVALDMDRVNYIDSSAIGWLLSANKSFRAGGGKLALHSLQPQVRQLLEMLKIDRVIPLAADLNAAKAALQSQPAAALAR